MGETILTRDSLAEWLINGGAECQDHQVSEKTFNVKGRKVSFLLEEHEGGVRVHAFVVALVLSVFVWLNANCLCDARLAEHTQVAEMTEHVEENVGGFVV